MTTEYNLPPSGRFTKKPATIEAWLIDLSNKPFPKWVNAAFELNDLDWSPDGTGLYINTLEGDMLGSNGDYLIRGVHGELYACKPAIFAATYEPESAAIEADRAAQAKEQPVSDPMTTERAEFEAWANGILALAYECEKGRYVDGYSETCFQCWQAARRTQPSLKALTDEEITEVWERHNEGIGTRRDLVSRIAKRLGVNPKKAV